MFMFLFFHVFIFLFFNDSVRPLNLNIQSLQPTIASLFAWSLFYISTPPNLVLHIPVPPFHFSFIILGCCRLARPVQAYVYRSCAFAVLTCVSFQAFRLQAYHCRHNTVHSTGPSGSGAAYPAVGLRRHCLHGCLDGLEYYSFVPRCMLPHYTINMRAVKMER